MPELKANYSRRQHKKYKSRFLEGLFQILESHEYDKIISWNRDGTRVLIFHPDSFAKTVIPRFYKHSSLASFIRQLHMYRFAKTYKEWENCSMTYEHPNFRRGRRDLLEKIDRSTAEPPKEVCALDEEVDQEPKATKFIKISAEESINSYGTLLTNMGFMETTTKDEVKSMDEKVRYIMAKYTPFWSGQKECAGQDSDKASTQIFAEFSKDLQKLLGFDKIDQE